MKKSQKESIIGLQTVQMGSHVLEILKELQIDHDKLTTYLIQNMKLSLEETLPEEVKIHLKYFFCDLIFGAEITENACHQAAEFNGLFLADIDCSCDHHDTTTLH